MNKNSANLLSVIAGLIFVGIIFNLFPINIALFSAIVLIALTAVITSYFIPYDESKIIGYTSWSIESAKRIFKGSTPNENEGEKIMLQWRLKDGSENDNVSFSRNDMNRMMANTGDLVYLCDTRRWLGGLKSIHTVYGESHNEDGVVYINKVQLERGLFDKNKTLYAEKEM